MRRLILTAVEAIVLAGFTVYLLVHLTRALAAITLAVYGIQR